MASEPQAPNSLVPIENEGGYALSQRAAEVCREIVEATAISIEGRKYVTVEGWQAIAISHGCTGSARDVEAVYESDGGLAGYRAVGEVRRLDTGAVVATGEGFVGVDETTWFGGKNRWGKELKKRPDYAIRAMAQTRGISRACRSAFAHVVVIINKDLGTTPAEEMIGLKETNEYEGMTQPEGKTHFRGQHRKAGAPLSKEEMNERKLKQCESAIEWVNQRQSELAMMDAEGLRAWEQSDEIFPRLEALRQGRDQQPGYEHLAPAWEHYQLTLDQLRKPT